MAEVLGEWRREGSPCTGAFVLWLRDLVAGAGWGVLDHRGRPKVAYHHLRRALAPVAVWSTDEGLGGIVAHVANDGQAPLRARLRIALYRDFRQLTDEVDEELEIAPHGQAERNVEAMLGRFVDVSWSYRFGPPAQDLVAVSLERDAAGETGLLAQAFRFPAGRPSRRQPARELGLSATVAERAEGAALVVHSESFAYGVRAQIPGYRLDEDSFSVEPGRSRSLALTPIDGGNPPAAGSLTALNLAGRVPIARGESV
jgi:beta-mannosidase